MRLLLLSLCPCAPVWPVGLSPSAACPAPSSFVTHPTASLTPVSGHAGVPEHGSTRTEVRGGSAQASPSAWSSSPRLAHCHGRLGRAALTEWGDHRPGPCLSTAQEAREGWSLPWPPPALRPLVTRRVAPRWQPHGPRPGLDGVGTRRSQQPGGAARGWHLSRLKGKCQQDRSSVSS